MAKYASAEEMLEELKRGQTCKIKIFVLGENIGNDFAFMDHYYCLKKLFPKVILDLRRSNVDDCNCIGYGDHEGKVKLPVDSMEMIVVKQEYPDDGKTWFQKMCDNQLDIFPDDFRDVSGYNYVWGIGEGEAKNWVDQYDDSVKFVNSGIVKQVIDTYNGETGKIPEDNVPIEVPDKWKKIKSWEWSRTAVEYLCHKEKDYPFAFTPEFEATDIGQNYRDYMFVSLRFPDYVRWYYSIDKQYDVLFDIIKKIKSAGKRAKLIYTLKDCEIGGNFNRGQTIKRLLDVKEAADDVLFVYTWTEIPRRGRLPEQVELMRLNTAGIHNISKLDIWGELLLAGKSKVCLLEPAGFLEALTLLRRDHNVFSFPTASEHISVFTTSNQDKSLARIKINPITLDQSYNCIPTMSPDNSRVMHWTVQYEDRVEQIGEDCHADDWKYFKAAQDGVFKDWYNMTKDDLVDVVVGKYIE